MDAVGPAVEECLPSGFAWLLGVVVMSILFRGTVRVEISPALLFGGVVLGVVFGCG